MPGKEVGDRVHNFFGQENLSQGQHHSQSIDGNWPGLSNNSWVGGLRQIGGPFVPGLKNYNVQQPELERGHWSQPSHVPHGLNLTQSNLKPEVGRVHSPSQQQVALNGYVHGNQVFQTRQNEASFLGAETYTNRNNLGARNLSMSQQGNAFDHKKNNSMRLDASELPVSFDLFGGQQQMSGQHINMMQPFPRQQSGNNDIQLLQQQLMLQRLQEFQRHQQLQVLETRQQGFTNQVSSVIKQAGVSLSPSMINGVPINEASHNLWQPELMANNPSWLQRGASPVMPGSSSGHMFPTEQGQALRLMDMVPQQADQSLYGVPISSTSGAPGSYAHIQMDKVAMQQISAINDSVSGNPYATFPNQLNVDEGTRQDFLGTNVYGSTTGQGLGPGFSVESLQQVNHHHRSPSMQEFQASQEVAESSEPSGEKSLNQGASSQNAAALDPTEENILFGSNDNIWEAFGGSVKMGMGGYNVLDSAEFSTGYSSLQSGSWSALMQSAVAESSSGDTGVQEEWCGASLQNSDAPTVNQQQASLNHGGELQTGVWSDNNFQPAVVPNSRSSPFSVEANRPNASVNSFGVPQFQQPDYKTQQVQGDMLHVDSSQRFIPKFSEPGTKWSDRGHMQKQSVEGNQIYGSVSHASAAETNATSNSGSWSRQQSTSSQNSDVDGKFQYGIGDVVDNEPMHSQNLLHPVSQGSRGYDQSRIVPSNYIGHVDKLETEMGHGPGSQADTRGFNATPSKSMFPGFAPNTSFARGISNYAPNKFPPSSQHMLELLHKVDHPREHGTPPHLSSSDRNMSSEMPEAETSDGSVGHVQRNQPSNSQNFGLQLAPPSQRLSGTDHAVSSQNSSKVVFGSAHVNNEFAEKGPMNLASRTSVVTFPSSYEQSQVHGNIKVASYPNVLGSYSTAFPSAFPYARNLENQHTIAASGHIMANQSVHLPFNRFSTGSKQLDDSSDRAQASQFIPSPASDLSATAPQNSLASSAETAWLSSPNQAQKRDQVQQILESDRGRATLSMQQGAFSKVLPNTWISVSSEQPSFGAQPSKAASGLFRSSFQSNDNSLTTFPGMANFNELEAAEKRNEASSTEIISAASHNYIAKEQLHKEISGQQGLPDIVNSVQKAISGLQGNDPVVNNSHEASIVSPTATQREIEAFGRSLRPNTSSNDSYSLLNQVQAMKSTEVNLSNRSSKRLKVSDHVVDPQQVNVGEAVRLPGVYNSAVRDSLPDQFTVPTGDLKMPSFPSKHGDAQDLNASSQPRDTFAYAQNISNTIPSSCKAPSIRGENPHISPRMAPSWFDQYGTFKNGPIMHAHDVQRTFDIKPMEQPLMLGKSADDQHARDSMEQGDMAVDGGSFSNIEQVSAPTSAVSEHFTSSQLIPHASDQSSVVERPKKRKTATSELVSWHKELMTISQKLQTISVAEAEWVKATNRLAEKVDEFEILEDAQPIIRARRRLILTSQLMQQLFRPPPVLVLVSNAGLQAEGVAYFSARLALGDACSAAGCFASEDPLLGEDKDLSSEKLKMPKGNYQYFSKVFEDFFGRAQKLENDFLRLDKRASILDVRVEFQDLEKFSVINRFAKFHTRGQTDGPETSGADGTLNGQKLCPQKYVIGLPAPRNLPDMVQCLSL